MGLFDKLKNMFTTNNQQEEVKVYDKGLEKTRKNLFQK